MYYLVYGLLYLISLLPLPILHLLSDLFYLIAYRIMGYRKKVVLKNLEIAFPEKTAKEREKIARKFYHNLFDTFIESVKLLSASPKWLNRHFIADYTIFHDLEKRGLKCEALLGHNFNWEVGNAAISTHVKQPMLTVYMPLSSKVMDRIFQKLRSRTGTIMIPATNMRVAMTPWRDKPYIIALVADQSPSGPDAGIWLPFFNRMTPFILGPEKSSVLYKTAIVFVHFTKKKRGVYEAHFQLFSDKPWELPQYEVTSRYASFLEQTIRDNPEMWLWSHRRWKWDYKPEYLTYQAPVAGN